MAYKPSPFEAASGVVVYATKNSGDSDNRYQVDSNGVASWGPGSAAVDVSVSRGGADQLDLAAGDSFHVLSGHVRVAGSGGTGVAYIDLDDGSSVTAGGVGEVRFRSNAGVFEISENGAAFAAPGGGGSLDSAYDFGGAHLGRTINVDASFPVLLSGGGTPPAPAADTLLQIHDSTAASQDAVFSISSGTSGDCWIYFGDSAAQIVSSIRWSNANTQLDISAGGADIIITSNSAGLIINTNGEAGLDTRMESDLSTNMFFLDAGANRVVMQKDDGSLPAISADTALVISNTSLVGDDVELSLISGTSGIVHLNFGDTADEDVGNIQFQHGTNLFVILAGNASLRFNEASGFVWNETASDVDARFESSNSQNMIFVDGGNDRVVMQKDDGSIPTISADTALVIANTSLVGDNVEMSLISGTTGVAILNFGDSANEDVVSIQFDNNASLLEIIVGSSTVIDANSGTGAVTINAAGIGSADFRVQGDILTHMIFTDATSTTENIAFLTTAAPNWQTGDRIIFWGSVETEPTAAPAGGAFMYVDALGNLQELNEAAEIGELAVAERREWWWQVNGNDTTAETVAMATPTVTGSAVANDGATGPFIQYDTTTTINLDAGWNGATNGARTDWGPVMTACVATDTLITSIRIWIGMFSGDPMGSADPALHIAAFRYDTVADGTAFWRCVTKDGTTINVTTTTIAIAADAVYNLRIDARNSASIKFYINGVLAATHTTNLPTSSTDLQVHAELQNLVAASRFLNLNKVHMATK